MLNLTRLLRRLALEVGRRCEGGICLELVELGSKEGLLFVQIALQRVDVLQLVREVLRGDRVLYESMRDALGVGGR